MAKLKTKLKIKTGGKKDKVKLVKVSESGIAKAEAMVAEMSGMNTDIQVLQAKLKEKMAPLKELEEEFIDLVEIDHAATDKVTITDGKHVIDLGARTQSRILNPKKRDKMFMALEKVKDGLALEGASIPLKFLDTYLDAETIAGFTTIKTGNRRLSYK